MPIKVQVIGADELVKIGSMGPQRKEKFMTDLFQTADKFALDAVAIAKKEYLSGPRPQKLQPITGRLRSGVNKETKRDGDTITAKIGDDVVYARRNELGGTFTTNVTTQMRRWAWAMFFKTADEKFKRLALTSKTQLTITTPPRPFLRPSIVDAMPSFQANIRTLLQKLDFVGGAA